MGLWPTLIMTPLHVHGARTPEAYRAMQAKYIQQGRLLHPSLNWRTPAVVADPLLVFVAGGKWVVRCPCGNCPSADPTWRLACCFECGAIYDRIVLPANAEAIAAVLVVRQHPSLRNWLPSERLEDLQAENARLLERVTARDASFRAQAGQ